MFSFFTNLSLRWKTITIVAPFSILIIILFELLFINSSKKLIETNLLQEQKNISELISNTISDLQTKALMVSSIFAKNDNVLAAYKNPDETKGSDFLKQAINPLIENIKKTTGIKDFQIHYHKPPARSFLRTWTNKRFDDLSKFRATVLEVNKTKQPLKAIEFGVGGFAIRGISPIVINGEHLGSVEFLYTMKDVIDLISSKSENQDFFELVDENLAQNILTNEQLTKNYPYKVPGFYISKANYEWVQPEKLIDDQIAETLKNSNESISKNLGDIYYSLIPIYDFQENKVGYIAFVKNNTKLIETQNKELVKNSVILVAILLVYAIIVILFIDLLIIRKIKIATEIAQKIARGHIEEVINIFKNKN